VLYSSYTHTQAPPDKHTFEVRILPVYPTASPILAAACLFEAVLVRAIDPRPVPWADADLAADAQGARELFDAIKLAPAIGDWLIAATRLRASVAT